MEETTNSNFANKLSVGEASNFSDFFGYLSVIVQERLFLWIWYVCILKILSTKEFRTIVVKSDGKVIGGFCLASFPIVSYKPYNWFNKKARQKVDELRKRGYVGFCCFVIKKTFRNGGVGTFAFSYLKENHRKVYFTSSPKAENFYIRNGARVFFPSYYDIYIFDGSEEKSQKFS